MTIAWRAIATLLLTACLAATASAQGTIRLGSVTSTRFPTNWTLDGPQMANTRAKLLNTANFGAGGIVANPIAITDTAATVGSVTASLLANFDVFFIGYLADGSANAFTAGELAAMQTWVNGGGTMVVTCDDASYDAVCALFGHPSSASPSAVNPVVPTAAGAAHPLFNGPFGALPSISMSGTQGAFTSTAGATILGQDSTPGTPLPTVLVQNFGAGRVVFLSDVDMLANAASNGAGITNNNDRFVGNVFAFAGNGAAPPPPPPAPYVPVPTLSEWGTVLLVLLLAATAMWAPRRRRP